ncbi:MAG: hypothetical protein EOO61_10405 [Hymenobacter sp.]|nr:MAG: hypothetical protein EOO61_10405 [Hymenobacter sp.]
MSIKSTINQNVESTEFPAFYITTKRGDDNYIILVTERRGTSLVGTVITESDSHDIGETSTTWAASCFERLNGSFTVTQG